MMTPEAHATHKLNLLQQTDHFRLWHSLDDKRVCVLCDRTFTGHDVIATDTRGRVELRCPTAGCRSGVHQWVYPAIPLVNENATADWWRALSQPTRTHIPAV